MKFRFTRRVALTARGFARAASGSHRRWAEMVTSRGMVGLIVTGTGSQRA